MSIYTKSVKIFQHDPPTLKLRTGRPKKMTDKKNTTKESIKKAPANPSTSKITKDKEAEVLAVIKTGGKQYLVEPGKWYNFEKIDAEVGKTVIFDEVLLHIDGSNVTVGKPTVGIKVTGKVLDQFKDDKVTVLKYKKRKRIRKKTGHRQNLTKVEITKIG